VIVLFVAFIDPARLRWIFWVVSYEKCHATCQARAGTMQSGIAFQARFEGTACSVKENGLQA
jgi:hypothetical protein